MINCSVEEQIEAELGIDEKVINQIFSCIVAGSIDEVRAKRNQFPSITYNSKYNDIWDSINGKCAASFCDGYSVTNHQRGIFEFITILNISASCVYILMKEKNFNKIISDNKSDAHYAKCMSLINDDLKELPQVYGQLSIFDLGVEMPENGQLDCKKKEVKNVIINKINNDIKRFVIITFEPDIELGVRAIYTNVVSNGTSIKYRKDWSDVIRGIDLPYEESAYHKKNVGVLESNIINFDLPAEVKIKKPTNQENTKD